LKIGKNIVKIAVFNLVSKLSLKIIEIFGSAKKVKLLESINISKKVL